MHHDQAIDPKKVQDNSPDTTTDVDNNTNTTNNSTSATNLMFEELMSDMGLQEDVRTQMRSWDESKKVLLLQQHQRVVHAQHQEKQREKDISKFHFEGALLKIYVMEARGLSKAYLRLYCKMSVQEAKFETDASSWNPPYDWTIEVTDLTATLNIQLWDKSVSDDFVGEISIPVVTLADNKVKYRWFGLQSREHMKDEVEGDLRLIVHFQVDKCKLPEKLEIGAQYEAILAGQGKTLPTKKLSLSEQWEVVKQAGFARKQKTEEEFEAQITGIHETLRNEIELKDFFLKNYNMLLKNADLSLVDKLVSLGCFEWTLEHIVYLYNKMRSQRKDDKDKKKIEILLTCIRKMMVRRSIISRLISIPNALVTMFNVLEYLPTKKKARDIQMLIACQDCNPFNSKLGDVVYHVLLTNENVFKLLLTELETGSDLKFKEIMLLLINQAIDNVSNLAKRLLVRSSIMKAGLTEAFLNHIAEGFPVTGILAQVEVFVKGMNDDRNEVLHSSSLLYSENFENALGLFTDIWVRMMTEKNTLNLANVLLQTLKIEADSKKETSDTIVKLVGLSDAPSATIPQKE